MKVIKWVILTLLCFIFLFVDTMEIEKEEKRGQNILPLLLKNNVQRINGITFLNEEVMVANINKNNNPYTRIVNLLSEAVYDITSVPVECDHIAVGFNNTVISLSPDFIHLYNLDYQTESPYIRCSIVFPTYLPTKLITHSKKPWFAMVSAEGGKYMLEIFKFDHTQHKCGLETIVGFGKTTHYKDHTIQNNAFVFNDDNEFTMVHMDQVGQLAIFRSDIRNPEEIIEYSKIPAALAVDPLARFLAVYGTDGSLVLIDLKEEQDIWEKNIGTNKIKAEDLVAHLFFSNDSSFLVLQIGSQKVTQESQQLFIFNTYTGSCFKELWLPASAQQVQISPNNTYLFVNDVHMSGGAFWKYPLKEVALKQVIKKQPLLKSLLNRELTGRFH